MKKTILSLIIIQIVMFPSVAFAVCTHAVGDVVKILPPGIVAEKMSNYAIVKDEFESTEEFNARKKTAMEQAPSERIIVEATYDPEYVHYDADAEKFSIEVYAWSNIGGGFRHSVPSGGGGHSIGLQVEQKITGSYKVSNAYGKEVEVVKSLINVYGIFDRQRKTNGANTWVFDFKESGNYADETNKAAGIFLPTPRSQAKTLKTDMRFGVEFTPKEPFLFLGETHFKPTVKTPQEAITKISSIVGNIECAILTDAKGTVLKVVETAY